MCSVAAGRAELFFELSLSPWDYAAGALIVKEAGGIVSDIDGKELDFGHQSSVVARNAVVQTIPQ
jgi:myo-inositol-1(or 4)-monophosphatase